MPSFTCATCGSAFDVPEATLAKFPGWKPKQCLKCKRGGSAGAGKPRAASREQNFTTAQVLERYKDGGWGAVYVVDGRIISEKAGHEAHTTNNRMELSALIAGYQLVPAGVATTVFTDSELCVNTITQWAATWERNGWKKKNGEIKNLELVKALYALAKSRPEITLKWIKAHAGSRWNEYADALATAYRRDER
jgi:ribonuclease HI